MNPVMRSRVFYSVPLVLSFGDHPEQQLPLPIGYDMTPICKERGILKRELFAYELGNWFLAHIEEVAGRRLPPAGELGARFGLKEDMVLACYHKELAPFLRYAGPKKPFQVVDREALLALAKRSRPAPVAWYGEQPIDLEQDLPAPKQIQKDMTEKRLSFSQAFYGRFKKALLALGRSVKQGGKFPTEEALADWYGVSARTMTQLLRPFKEAGLLEVSSVYQGTRLGVKGDSFQELPDRFYQKDNFTDGTLSLQVFPPSKVLQGQLDRKKSLAVQVFVIMAALIQQHYDIWAHKKIPDSAALAARFQVSSSVLEKALMLLKADGWIEGAKALGYRVRPLENSLHREKYFETLRMRVLLGLLAEFKPGDRVWSAKTLARMRGMSYNSVLLVYQYLEWQGILRNTKSRQNSLDSPWQLSDTCRGTEAYLGALLMASLLEQKDLQLGQVLLAPEIFAQKLGLSLKDAKLAYDALAKLNIFHCHQNLLASKDPVWVLSKDLKRFLEGKKPVLLVQQLGEFLSLPLVSNTLPTAKTQKAKVLGVRCTTLQRVAKGQKQ